MLRDWLRSYGSLESEECVKITGTIKRPTGKVHEKILAEMMKHLILAHVYGFN